MFKKVHYHNSYLNCYSVALSVLVLLENYLHYVFDMTSREYEQRKRANYAAASFAIVKKNLYDLKDLKQHEIRFSY